MNETWFVRIYIRVSTEEQADEGYSIDAQNERLKAYALSQDWVIQETYIEEGVSGKNMDRPELKRLLSDLKSDHSDHKIVLVYKLDRLTRSVSDLHTLLDYFDRHQTKFRSATEVYDTTTAIGRLFITLVAAMAQWERENLAERTKMGQIEMTRQGKWSGGRRPFGYDYNNGNLEINHAEAAIVKEIYHRYLAGSGTPKILKWLNNPTHPQLASNKRWTLHNLKYVLQNPLYCGMVRYGYRDPKGKRQDEFIVEKGNHKNIIELDDFNRAQELRNKRKTMPSRSGTGTYSLTGILRCGKCGYSMSGDTRYKKNKLESEARRYYTCVERVHSGLCDMPRQKESKLENAVLTHLEQYHQVLNSDFSTFQFGSDTQNEIDAIHNEISKISSRKNRWMNAYENGDIESNVLKDRLSELRTKEANFLKKISELEKLNNKSLDIAMLKTILNSFRKTWDIATVEERKELLRTIVKEITVFPDQRILIHFHGGV